LLAVDSELSVYVFIYTVQLHELSVERA